jgi:2,4-dienoyl-CoA reductase-like NADH-dependent reductase (Old Yellow Enzyme family)
LTTAALRADRAGFDLLELNLSTEHLHALLPAIRAVWPEHKPLAIRAAGDLSLLQARAFKSLGVDLIHLHFDQPMCSTARCVQLRLAAELPVLITRPHWSSDEANTDLAAGRADLSGVLPEMTWEEPWNAIRAQPMYFM